MRIEQLKSTLKAHEDWLEGKEGGVRADLSGKEMIGMDLDGSNLRNSNLSEAVFDNCSLRGVDFSKANLCKASFLSCNLDGANFSNANAKEANFKNSNLKKATFHSSFLSKSCFKGANLRGASFCHAYAYGADFILADLKAADFTKAVLNGSVFSGAITENTIFLDAQLIGVTSVPEIPLACPEYGTFTGYKKCADGLIVELEILDRARRSSATGTKCRCDKAKVISIKDSDGNMKKKAKSCYDSSFVYHVGKIAKEPAFNENRFMECAEGIHFFMSLEEAMAY